MHFWSACQSRFLWGVGRTQGGRGRIARQKYLVDLGRVGVLVTAAKMVLLGGIM